MKASSSRLNALNISICIILLSTTLISHAKESTLSPDFINGAIIIAAETLIKYAEQTPELVIIDSRLSSDRQQGFIEGSFNLPDSKTSCSTLSNIIASKDIPVIFYCNGPKCGRSSVAVKISLLCGYKNIYWFRGGFEEWKQKNYPYITGQ